MLIIALFLYEYAVPTIGNGELRQAFNAALGQLQRSGQLQIIHQRYFGFVEDATQPIFEDLFAFTENDIIIPGLELQDCAGAQPYPEITQITPHGALSDVLNSRQLFVHYSADAPGFFEYPDFVKTKSFGSGFERDLIKAAAELISCKYLSAGAQITVIFREEQNKISLAQNAFDYNKKQSQKISKKARVSTTFQQLANGVTKRSFHVMAGGLANVQQLELGNAGCGTVAQEVGVLVNFQALKGFQEVTNKDISFEDLKQAVINVKNVSDLVNALKKNLNTNTAPVCVRRGSYAYYQVINQLDFNNQQFPNIYTGSYTTNFESGIGAFDLFLQNKCVFFVSESAIMLNLMKTLQSGYKMGVYGGDIYIHADLIKFKYLFGLQRVNENEINYLWYLKQNAKIQFATRTFQSAFSFLPDTVDFNAGNEQLSQVINYAFDKYSHQLFDLTQTKFNNNLDFNLNQNNFIQNLFSDNATNLLNQTQLIYVSNQGRRAMNKLYNFLNASNQINESLINSAISKIVQTFPSFDNLMQLLNNNSDNKLNVEFNHNAYFLQTLISDQLLQSRIYAAILNDNVVYGRQNIQIAQISDVQVQPKEEHFYNIDGELLFKIERIPDTFNILGIFYNKNGKFQNLIRFNQHKNLNFIDVITTVNTVVGQIINDIYPDLFYTFQLYNQIINDFGLTNFTNCNTLENTSLNQIFNNSTQKNFIIQNSNTKLIEMFDTATNAVINFPDGNSTYYYKDFTQITSYATDKQINLINIRNFDEFKQIVGLYPYSVNVTSQSLIDDKGQQIISKINCQVQTVKLINIPSIYHDLVVSSNISKLDMYQNVQLCVQESAIPVSLTQQFTSKPSLSPTLKLGTYDYIQQKSRIYVGMLNNQDGIHQPNYQGIDDIIMQNLAYQIFQITGRSIPFIPVEDHLDDTMRQNVLSGMFQVNNEADIDMVLSAQMAQQYKTNIASQKNYLKSNITFLSFYKSKCSKFLNQFTQLSDYSIQHSCFQKDNTSKTSIKFCTLQQSNSFFVYFKQKYENSNHQFVQMPKQSTQQFLNEIMNGNCDFGIIYDYQILNKLKNIKGMFVYQQYSEYDINIAPILRKDTIDIKQMVFEFKDQTPLIMTIFSTCLIACTIIVISLICTNLRQWILLNNQEQAQILLAK